MLRFRPLDPFSLALLTLITGCAVSTGEPDAPSDSSQAALTSSRPVPSASDETLAALRFGLSIPCERPNEDAFPSAGYHVLAGSAPGDLLGPSYARSELVAEAGQGFAVSVCSPRPSHGGLGFLTTVEFFYKVDGGPVQKATVLPKVVNLPPSYWADSAGYVIPVPASAVGTMEVWAKVNVSGGKHYWVSRNGANFKADVMPSTQTSIVFAAPADGHFAAPTVAGALVRGHALRLQYGTERMTAIMGQCQGYHSADHDPSTEAFVSFRDGEGSEVLQYSIDASTDAPVEIPSNASSVAVWFRGLCSAATSRVGWDSAFGRNYVFPVAESE